MVTKNRPVGRWKERVMSDVDPDVAATMAYNLEQKIGRLEAKADCSKMRFIFRDGSELHLALIPTPSLLKVTGAKYSISSRFQSSVKEIRPVAGAGGVEFVFHDGSKFAYSRDAPLGHPAQ
jgi:hypothetical protein